MRDVLSECIEFKNNCTFYGLADELWSGARERWIEADETTRIAVWDRVKEWADAVSCDGELPSMTQINDIIWFECDDLFYPPTFTVEVYVYDNENEAVEDKIEEFTQKFTDRDEAVEYAESLINVERRITLTNDDTGDVEEDW